MTPAWWIHLANYILQYPYQKHRPHISFLVTQSTSLRLGGWLETSVQFLHGAWWNWRTGHPQLVLRELGRLGRSRFYLPSIAELESPCSDRKVEARSGAGSDSPPGDLPGNQSAKSGCLSENQGQAAPRLPPTFDVSLQSPFHCDQQEGKKEQGYICVAGTPRNSGDDGQWGCVRSQSLPL